MHPHPDVPTSQPEPDTAVSILEILARVLEARRLVAQVTLASLLVTILITLASGRSFTTTATILPSGGATAASGTLQQLVARQIGGDPNSSGLGQTLVRPEFVIELATSPVILDPLLLSRFPAVAAVMGGDTTVTLLDFLVPVEEQEASADTAVGRALRMKLARIAVESWIQARSSPSTGAVTIRVTTEWPAVSKQVAEALLERINAFAISAGQASARDELEFAQQRLREREERLRAAEFALAAHLAANRSTSGSPMLSLERERLQRDVAFHQQLMVGLAQSVEDARIREVRDTPLIAVIEPPEQAPRPDPRNLLVKLVVAAFVGIAVGSAGALLVDAFRRAVSLQDPAALALSSALRGIQLPGLSRLRR